MISKKKILIFSQWFYPAYKAGGPIQSVFNLVNQLSTQFEFHIVASDRDLFQTQPLEGIAFNQWTVIEGIPVIYLTPENQTKSFFEKIIKEGGFDTVYLNSMFAIKFSLVPLWIALKLNKQVILAPRGMLGAGAMKVGMLKKKLFIAAFKLFNLHKKITWQATAESELQEIQDNFGKHVKIKIAPNLSKKTEYRIVDKPKTINQLKLFFLSRVAIKKNLLGALQILEKIPNSYTIELDIIGPCEDEEYWKKCIHVINRLPNHIKVTNTGPLPNFNIAKHIKNYHFLFLPTFNENFGHVIMESWQQACPVIISDQTPWKNLKNNKVGWDIALSNEPEFVNAIIRACEMTNEEYNEWAQSSLEHAQEFCKDEKLLKSSIDLFS